MFAWQLLRLLTDKQRACLSSVCWCEAVSSPSCQSGVLCSSLRLLAAIRWIISHLFLSNTLEILQASSNRLLETWQMPNAGRFFPLKMNVKSGICYRSMGLFVGGEITGCWGQITICSFLNGNVYYLGSFTYVWTFQTIWNQLLTW